MSTIALIVGLGNPGAGHAHTRHNAGFWFADELVKRSGGGFSSDRRSGGELATVNVADHAVRVLKPLDYMNLSGQAVRALTDFHRIAPEAVLVVHDDLDLKPGTVRLKLGGGHGGHNGLRDVTAHIGPGYYRLRLGIGHPRDADGVDPVDWVLRKPGKEDELAIRAAIDAAMEALPRLFEERGDERVMEILNG